MSTKISTRAAKQRFAHIRQVIPGLLAQHPDGLHMRELTAELKAPDYTIGRVLGELRKEKIVSVKGSNRHAVWTVVREASQTSETEPSEPPRQKGGNPKLLAVRGAKDRAAILAAIERAGKPLDKGELFELLEIADAKIPQQSLSNQLGKMHKQGLIVPGLGKTWVLRGAASHSHHSNGALAPVTIEQEYVIRLGNGKRIITYDEAMNLFETLKQLLRVE